MSDDHDHVMEGVRIAVCIACGAIDFPYDTRLAPFQRRVDDLQRHVDAQAADNAALRARLDILVGRLEEAEDCLLDLTAGGNDGWMALARESAEAYLAGRAAAEARRRGDDDV